MSYASGYTAVRPIGTVNTLSTRELYQPSTFHALKLSQVSRIFDAAMRQFSNFVYDQNEDNAVNMIIDLLQNPIEVLSTDSSYPGEISSQVADALRRSPKSLKDFQLNLINTVERALNVHVSGNRTENPSASLRTQLSTRGADQLRLLEQTFRDVRYHYSSIMLRSQSISPVDMTRQLVCTTNNHTDGGPLKGLSSEQFSSVMESYYINHSSPREEDIDEASEEAKSPQDRDIPSDIEDLFPDLELGERHRDLVQNIRWVKAQEAYFYPVIREHNKSIDRINNGVKHKTITQKVAESEIDVLKTETLENLKNIWKMSVQPLLRDHIRDELLPGIFQKLYQSDFTAALFTAGINGYQFDEKGKIHLEGHTFRMSFLNRTNKKTGEETLWAIIDNQGEGLEPVEIDHYAVNSNRVRPRIVKLESIDEELFVDLLEPQLCLHQTLSKNSQRYKKVINDYAVKPERPKPGSLETSFKTRQLPPELQVIAEGNFYKREMKDGSCIPKSYDASYKSRIGLWLYRELSEVRHPHDPDGGKLNFQEKRALINTLMPLLNRGRKQLRDLEYMRLGNFDDWPVVDQHNNIVSGSEFSFDLSSDFFRRVSSRQGKIREQLLEDVPGLRRPLWQVIQDLHIEFLIDSYSQHIVRDTYAVIVQQNTGSGMSITGDSQLITRDGQKVIERHNEDEKPLSHCCAIS